jgi:hypothetical protein
MTLNISKIDVPNLVKTNTIYDKVELIKNYEDTLEKIFITNEKSNLVSNSTVFLYKIIDKDNLFDNIKNITVEKINEYINFNNNNVNNNNDNNDNNDIMKDIFITGTYIRSHINYQKNYENYVKKELILYNLGDKKWKNIVDLSLYVNNSSEYVYNANDFKIILIKKKYKSESHILLQNNYLKRVGWKNGIFYVSYMFLIEYKKTYNLINMSFRDPHFKTSFDPLDIYCVQDKKKEKNLIKIIDLIDLQLLNKFKNIELEKLQLIKNNHVNFKEECKKTCIEYALEKYLKCEHPILKNELKQIILYLSNITYKRPLYLYYKYLNIYDNIEEIIYSLKNKYNIIYDDINNICFKSVDDIDNYIIEHCIIKDNPIFLFDYLKYIEINVNKNILSLIIKNKSLSIISYIIKNKSISLNLIYYLILMTEELDMFKNIEFNIDVALNYLKDIIENCLISSFYFLYKCDNSIINFLFENDNTLLHIINLKNINKDKIKCFINLILKLNPELINKTNIYNQTVMIYHSEKNPYDIDIFYDFIFDPTILDNDENTFLHHLCKYNVPLTVKKFATKYIEILNLPNKNYETPIIISCINNLEDVFYKLKSLDVSLNSKDIYGNTIYHYICKNSMCIGMIIENTKNIFGYMPSDYCVISNKYYNFV